MTNSASSLATYTTLMRVTPAGRPYCQDLNDLFSALVIQHGVKDHRHRFRTIPNSFVFADAIQTLGNLQFTHIIKTPDPSDPTRLIATRTTTTFSMSPKMGRTLSQHFVSARLFENAIDPTSRVMKDKAIWVLSPKAKFVIQDFSQRARVPIQNLMPALNKIESFQVVILERLADRDDQLALARPNMTIAFKTMMAYLPLESLLADDAGGIDKCNLEEYQYAFFGYQAFEWISEYTTAATRDEAELIASEFVLYGWISQILDKSDRANSSKDDSVLFKMGRNTMYHVTARGRQILGWDKPYTDDTSLADTHEQVIQRQRVLAARLHRNSSTSPRSLTRAAGKAIAGEHAATGKRSGIASSVSSGSSNEEPMSDVEANSDFAGEDSALRGLTGVELMSPMVQTGEAAALAPASDSQKDLDEVTERLLQLRSPGNPFHAHKRQDTAGSTATNPTASSRPSSLCTQDSISLAALDPSSSWSKLRQILLDPLIRMYFRDFLKSQFCEENVNIWVDYYNLRKKVQRYNHHDMGANGNSPVTTRELLQDSYAIYDTYIAPTATAEVNIDHQLRQEIVAYVSATFTVYNNSMPTASSKASAAGGSIPFVSTAFQPTHQRQITLMVNGQTNQCLKTLLRLYDRVDDHICRIMAQDSVPKFVKTEKYIALIVNSTTSHAPIRRNSTEQNLDAM